MKLFFPKIIFLCFISFLLNACGGQKGIGSGHSALDSALADTNSIEFEIQRLNGLIATNGLSHELYRQRSLVMYKSGDSRAAIADIEKAISLYDKSPDLWHLKGFYQYILKEDSLSLASFKQSAQLGSDNPETFFQVGQIYFFRGDFNEAGKWYQTAIELDSLNPGYYFAFGFLKQQEKKVKDAIRWYEKALEKDPSHIKSLSQLHDLYLDSFKDIKRAQDYNDLILKVDSLHPIGHFNEGNHFLNLGMGITEESKKQEFEMLLRLAVSEYSTALRSDPGFTLAWYNRGYALFLIDDLDAALFDFEKVLTLDPMNYRAHFMLGSIKEHFNDLKGAQNHYQNALKLEPEFRDAQIAVEEIGLRLKGKKE